MNIKILICDDEIHILRAAEFKLKKAGHEVWIAGDGEEGWETMQQCMPDIVITDCQMPRLDGLGLVERMRRHEATAKIPVFMLTAKGLELSHDKLANELNILRVISKPFSPRELLEEVNALFQKASLLASEA